MNKMNYIKIIAIVTILIIALVSLPVFLTQELKAEMQIQIDELQKQIQETAAPDVDLYIADLQEQIDAIRDDLTVIHAEPEPTIEPTPTVEPTPTIKNELEMTFLGDFKIVGYYKGGNGLTTATGVKCKAGVTIAVDPKVIPYGTYVYIEDIGIRLAQDCGGFTGKVIDVYWKTESQCYSWNDTPKDSYRKVWIIK
jgi:3D (Asp-Asp-Asp) domain-containing protein